MAPLRSHGVTPWRNSKRALPSNALIDPARPSVERVTKARVDVPIGRYVTSTSRPTTHKRLIRLPRPPATPARLALRRAQGEVAERQAERHMAQAVRRAVPHSVRVALRRAPVIKSERQRITLYLRTHEVAALHEWFEIHSEKSTAPAERIAPVWSGSADEGRRCCAGSRSGSATVAAADVLRPPLPTRPAGSRRPGGHDRRGPPGGGCRRWLLDRRRRRADLSLGRENR